MNRTFEHMAWADRRLLKLLHTSEAARQVPGVMRLLSHVVAAERVWLMRLRGQESGAQPIWPEWPLDELTSTAEENAHAYQQLAGSLSEADRERVVEYRNSQGVAFSTRVADILTHVVLHGSYHRGQIAAALRAGGVEPVNTDYITYVRELV